MTRRIAGVSMVAMSIVWATCARADEMKKNAWGFYGGPTTYELNHSSTEYNRATMRARGAPFFSAFVSNTTLTCSACPTI